jgi:hypothetical protein
MIVKATLKKLILRVNELSRDGGVSPIPETDFTPVPETAAPSAANQLRNGDLSHSVRTWNSGAVGNQDYECAHFFTHDAPAAAQQLDESTGFADLNVDADANAATNKTLKSSAHASYSASYCDWDRTKGQGRLQGTKTLDAPLPANTATPGRTMCLAFILALRSAQIVVPPGFRLFAGLWDNTAAQRDWLTATTAFTLTGTVRGTPAGTTERRYKVFLFTDRGYTFLSQELTLLAAPTDPSFSSVCDVYLSWDLIPGVLEAHVYRFNAVAGTYDLLEKTSSNTYADNGTKLQAGVGAYPAATDTTPKSYVATETGALDGLAVDGVDAAWDALFLNIPVPKLYNQGLTLDRQWLRIGANMALDRRVTDAVVNNASTNIASASAAFTALDSTRSVTLTDGPGNTHTTTVTYVNATNVTMAAAWPHANATGVTLLVTGGGDQGLLVDLIHLSYVPGAAYAPYPEDLNRALQPAAAPNGSTQGGTVGGGGGSEPGGGGISCVEESEPVLVFEGERVRAVPFSEVRVGQSVYTGELRRSRVQKIIRGEGPLVRLETENGIRLDCSPSHKVITTRSDTEGRAVERVRVGDPVMTVLRGRVEQTRVRRIADLGRSGKVGTFKLAPGNVYAAGREFLPAGWPRSCWKLWRLIEPMHEPSGVLSHNVKIADLQNAN